METACILYIYISIILMNGVPAILDILKSI